LSGLLDALVRLQIPVTPCWRFGMTRPGVLLAGVLAGLWMAALYSGNNLLYLCGAMLTALTIASLWQAVRLLKSMPMLADSFPAYTEAGDPFILRKQMHALSPLTAVVDIEWRSEEVNIPLQVRLEESAVLTGRLKAGSRGVFKLKRQFLTTTAPLGLWKIGYLRDDPVDWIAVPRPVPWLLALSGKSRQMQPFEGDELRDLRGYVPGDAISRIHWRKSASDITRWSVKRFERHEPEAEVLKLRVDLRLPDSTHPESFEHLLGQAWYWVGSHLQRGEKSLQVVLGQQLFDLSIAGQKQGLVKALAEATPRTSPPAGQDGALLSLLEGS